ncbi:hypothetical protein SAMN05428945_4048 [Streptomyces sp. 2224.1]|nr:hypothetical protein BX261_1289 [Streptomyces sp. 2321.6]SDR55130.1 hypothetical protein SAMN05216511_5927 [Streptomyces sp. KS_16]SEC14239.1 hypothetical protein SAMN05428940_1289 [Streptomyces sp. 2133.1]SED16763.1 hypothetical protein SAMN05428945_4048 [Streptomyces sp. 2224.1]SEF08070.1 hypothetical protein SAMN05428954_5990 [Streptomyces sp. 2112.3]SNC65290.1 hypothetical protein SAMN06272741_1287 [Streptomyces sp. 2114.4]
MPRPQQTRAKWLGVPEKTLGVRPPLGGKPAGGPRAGGRPSAGFGPPWHPQVNSRAGALGSV